MSELMDCPECKKEILRCPCCGVEDITIYKRLGNNSTVTCSTHKCRMTVQYFEYTSDNDVIDIWNNSVKAYIDANPNT